MQKIIFTSADLLPDDFRKLQSKRLSLLISEANGHATQEALPLPVEEKPLRTPEIITCFHQPVGKPRMTVRVKWQRTEREQRYFDYAAALRKAAQDKLPAEIERVTLRFYIGFPKSYPVSKRLQLDGKPHFETPDIDNLAKSVMDSLLVNDEIIAELHASKFWTNGEPRTEIIFQ